jgi:hypothetical protein
MITLAVDLLPPIVILIWIWVARATCRAEAVLIALIATAAVTFAWFQGPLWPLLGMFWRWLMALLLAIAVWRLARRSAPLPALPRRGVLRARILVPFVVFMLVGAQTGWALAGRFTSVPAVALEWPLRSGRFVIAHGGSTRPINAHHGIAAQNYALDVLALNRFGFRAASLSPAALDRYVIFDRPIHAPCAGEVVAARDGLADAAPTTEPSRLAGNFVAIFCQGVTVVLAHAKAGTVAVRTGDTVPVGQMIGRVGNSGNSSEPHLHIHAVAGRVADSAVLVTTASGVPMTFGGRFLSRNDVVF